MNQIFKLFFTYMTFFCFACLTGLSQQSSSQQLDQKLFKALKATSISRVKKLLQQGANSNGRYNYYEETPLMIAAEEDSAALVELLLNEHALVNEQDARGDTALHYAIKSCWSKSSKVLQKLIQAGANVSLPDHSGVAPLHKVVRCNNSDMLHELIKAGADVNFADDFGTTVLHIAADNGNSEIVQKLIQAGARVNVADKKGDTPLMLAAASRNKPHAALIVKILIDANANVNAQNEHGATPLHFAALSNNSDVMQELIKAGADSDLANNEGETPLAAVVESLTGAFALKKVPEALLFLVKAKGEQLLKYNHTAREVEAFSGFVRYFIKKHKKLLALQDIKNITSLLSLLSGKYKLTSPYVGGTHISSEQVEDLLCFYDISILNTQRDIDRISDPAESLPKIFPQAAGLTQTEAYLSVPKLREEVLKTYRRYLNDYPLLVRRIIEQEKRYKNYDVFYHGQKKEFILFYDIIKEIQNWFDKERTADFEYLRFPENQNIHIAELSKLLESLNVLDDDNPVTINHLLSVNLSLFGNTSLTSDDESSFDFFFTNKSINSPRGFLKILFSKLGLDEKYLSAFFDLLTYLESPTGSLLQIFIPRDKVNNYVYLASAYGKPLRILSAQKELPLKPIVFKEQDGVLATYDPKAIDTKTYLDLYRNHPEAINPRDLDRIQARINITRDFLLNPKSGVKILRYTTVHPEKLLEYQQKLREIVKEVMEDWKKRTTSVAAA